MSGAGAVPMARRRFLGALGAAAGLAVAGPSAAATGAIRVGAPRLQPRSFVVNMLGGIRNPNRGGSRGPLGGDPADGPLKLDERALADALASGTVAVNTTIGYFMPFLAADGMAVAEDVVRHIEHAVRVCGEEHVGIGTDGGTTAVDDLDGAYEAARREVEARRRAGISAAGEGPGVVPFIPDLQGPNQFRKLADMLAARGHASERIERILGRNALRVMRDVWGE